MSIPLLVRGLFPRSISNPIQPPHVIWRPSIPIVPSTLGVIGCGLVLVAGAAARNDLWPGLGVGQSAVPVHAHRLELVSAPPTTRG